MSQEQDTVADLIHALRIVACDCQMALSGEWDRSDEGFEATLELVTAAIERATKSYVEKKRGAL